MIKKRINLNKKTKKPLVKPVLQVVRKCDASQDLLIRIHPAMLGDVESWGTLLSDLAVYIAKSLHSQKMNSKNQSEAQILEIILEKQEAEIARSIEVARGHVIEMHSK